MQAFASDDKALQWAKQIQVGTAERAAYMASVHGVVSCNTGWSHAMPRLSWHLSIR